jgi:AraC family transcriptional regulator, transcriptional activator of pobA
MDTISPLQISELNRHSGDEFHIKYDSELSLTVNEFTVEGLMMILCHGGEMSVEIDGKAFSLKTNSLLILPEKRFVRIGATSADVRTSFLYVSTDFILDMPSPIDTNIFIYSRLTPMLGVDDEKLADFASYFRFIAKESREPSRYRTNIIRALVFALLLEITAEYEDQYELGSVGKIHDESVSDRFFRLLAANFRVQRTVSWYASRMNLTPKYLSQVIKSHTGRTILDWIHESVMTEARMLLKTTELTIQQISDRLSFSSPSAFVQFFRKHSGHTPGAERE